ncbi:MAG: hypothetical protein QXL69_06355 [Candidatus Bathyarchaeia archaeon]|nr:hypothetical protein [Candidatus Bathyarchaeota archaeon]
MTQKILWKIKLKTKDLIYTVKKRRVKPKLSATTLFIIVLVFSVFIFSGGIFAALEKPLALLPSSTGWTFIYRGNINVQTLSESLVSAFLYLIGVVGLYLLYKSIKMVYRPREAYITLIIGFTITILSVYYLITLMQQKISG